MIKFRDPRKGCYGQNAWSWVGGAVVGAHEEKKVVSCD